MSPLTILPIILLILYAALCGLGRLVKGEEKEPGFKLFTVAFYGILWTWGVAILCIGVFLFLLSLLQDNLPYKTPADLAKLKAGFKVIVPFSIACLSVGILSITLMFKRVRIWLSQWLPFQIESPLHHFGLLLVLPAIAIFISSSLMVSPKDIIEMMKKLDMLQASAVNTAYFIGFTLIGIGWGYARNTKQTFERLGLKKISKTQACQALAIALGMFLFLSFALDPVLRLFLPSDTAFQETIMQLTKPGKSTGNVPLEIFLVSLMAGVGEEIFFRGLLMPVIGLVPSAILFALIHLQYGIGSGIVIVLFSGLLLGWLRQRYGTTYSIITHTAYDILALSAVSFLMKPH